MSVDTSNRNLARLQHDLKHSITNEVFAEARAVIKALQAERDAAVKDAERYQWLKQRWTTTLLDGSIQMASSHGIRCKSVSEIDAAIDAERGNP